MTLWPLDEAGQDLGKQYAEALALSQSVTAENARTRLDWAPRSWTRSVICGSAPTGTEVSQLSNSVSRAVAVSGSCWAGP
ncbi:hypothetical protein ACFQ9X_36355 [Catenulispora yoronensis]